MPDWSQLTVGVAAIVGLIYVARTLRSSQRDLLDFLYNHLSENTKAQVATTKALTKLADAVDHLGDEARSAHEQARRGE